MKNIKYFLAALSIFALAFGCQVKETYEPGEPELKNSKGVFFQELDVKYYEFTPDEPHTVTVTVERPNAVGALNNIPLELDNELFSVSDVSFADGQLATEATITLLPEAQIGVRHKVEVSITDPKYINIYGLKLTSVVFEVMVVKWNVISTNATYSDLLFPWLAGGNIVDNTVTVEERDDLPGFIRIVKPYTLEYCKRIVTGTINDGLEAYLAQDDDLYINATNPNKVWIGLYRFNILGWGFISYSKEAGFSSGTMYGVWQNGVLTMPQGSLLYLYSGEFDLMNPSFDWVLLDCHLAGPAGQ